MLLFLFSVFIINMGELGAFTGRNKGTYLVFILR